MTNETHPLAVWYGEMPESNGKRNWTASLHRKGGCIHMDGFCFARSEHPDRVRYEADRMRWIIGELPERPFILDYDADLHSGYVAPPDTAHAAALAEARRDAYRDGWRFAYRQCVATGSVPDPDYTAPTGTAFLPTEDGEFNGNSPDDAAILAAAEGLS